MKKIIILLVTSIFLVWTTYADEIEYNNEYWDLCIEWWPMSKYSFSEWSNTYWDINIKLVNKK